MSISTNSKNERLFDRIEKGDGYWQTTEDGNFQEISALHAFFACIWGNLGELTGLWTNHMGAAAREFALLNLIDELASETATHEVLTAVKVEHAAKNLGLIPEDPENNSSSKELTDIIKQLNLAAKPDKRTTAKNLKNFVTNSPDNLNLLFPNSSKIIQYLHENKPLSQTTKLKHDEAEPITDEPKNAVETLIESKDISSTPSNPLLISDKLKAAHVFIFSGPYENPNTGDGDYSNRLVEYMQEANVNISFLTGAVKVDGQSLYNPSDIEYEEINSQRKIIDNIKRHTAVQNLTNYILSFDGDKILHIQLRTPETGCMILPEEIKKLKSQGVKIVVTCHEWQLNNHRKFYQEQAYEYFKEADQVVFLNQKDADPASKFYEDSPFPAPISVSAVPVTVSISNPAIPSEVVARDKNILIFGMLRANKGFENAIELAHKIKKKNLSDVKVIIAGKPMSLKYFSILLDKAFHLSKNEKTELAIAWKKDSETYVEVKKFLKQIHETRKDIVPIEFHIDLNEIEMEKLSSSCKYAYKPDNKGFANNASAIINLLAQGCITFAKWGKVTDDSFLKGGAHQDALILSKEFKPSLNDLYPSPDEVLEEIERREADPNQTDNLITAAAALNAVYSAEGLFSKTIISSQTVAIYESSLK